MVANFKASRKPGTTRGRRCSRRSRAVTTDFFCSETAVGRLERFAQAFGDPAEDVTDTAYGDVAQELAKQGYVS
jgi:hypothetical protein